MLQSLFKMFKTLINKTERLKAKASKFVDFEKSLNDVENEISKKTDEFQIKKSEYEQSKQLSENSFVQLQIDDKYRIFIKDHLKGLGDLRKKKDSLLKSMKSLYKDDLDFEKAVQEEKEFRHPYKYQIIKIKKSFENDIISEDTYNKLLKSIIEKAKKSVIGEVHTWANGEKYQKTSKGWVNLKTGKNRSSEIAEVDKKWLDKYKSLNLNRLPLGIKENDVEVGGDSVNWALRWVDPVSGKKVSAYPEKFLKENSMKKWDRIKNISPKDIEDIKSKSLDLLKSNSDKEKQIGAILTIISNTGLRIGSRNGFLRTQNRGVTTLNSDNIKINNDVVGLEFIGKSYQNNTATIKSKELSKFLSEIKDKKSGENFVFDVKDSDIREYFHKNINKDLKIKDLRTYIATDLAKNILKNDKTQPPPVDGKVNKKQLQQKLMRVFKEVSNKLNNTPTMAKTSYVHPEVIDNWLLSIGINPKTL